MFAPYPISLAQYAAFLARSLVFVLLPHPSRFAPRDQEAGARRDRRSRVGIALQSIGIRCAGFGPVRPALPWWAPARIGLDTARRSASVAAAIALFAVELATTGKELEPRRAHAHRSRTGPQRPLRRGPPPDLSRAAAVPAQHCGRVGTLAAARCSPCRSILPARPSAFATRTAAASSSSAMSIRATTCASRRRRSSR